MRIFDSVSSSFMRKWSGPLDLIWTIRRRNSQGGIVLEHELRSPSGAVPIQVVPARSPLLSKYDWERYGREAFRRVEDLLDGEVARDPVLMSDFADELLIVGEKLSFRLVPEKIQAFFKTHGDNIESLLLESNDPWIPWELTVLEEMESENTKSHRHLCCRYRMTRWFPQKAAPRMQFQLKHLLGLTAPSVDDYRPLPFVEDERERLAHMLNEIEGLEGSVLSNPSVAEARRRLAEDPFDWFHFAGHGTFDPEHPDESSLVMRDKGIRVEHLNKDLLYKIAIQRPFVFLNACHAARQGHALTGLGGWPSRWIEFGGCGALICPQWAVDDSSANRFSDGAYRRLAEGQSLGEAILATRLELLEAYPTDLTPLAYSVYGHPHATVSFGEKDVPVSLGRPSRRSRLRAPGDEAHLEPALGLDFNLASSICDRIDRQLLRSIRDHSNLSEEEIHRTYELLIDAHLAHRDGEAGRLLSELGRWSSLRKLLHSIKDPSLVVMVDDDLDFLEVRHTDARLRVESPRLLWDCNCGYPRIPSEASPPECKIHGAPGGNIIGQLFAKGLSSIRHRGVDVLWRGGTPALWPPSIDSFHFARVLSELENEEPMVGSLLDMGSGTGFLGLMAATVSPAITRVTFTDWLLTPLLFSAANFARSSIASRVEHELRLGLNSSWLLDSSSVAAFDLLVCNPPYLPLSENFKALGPVEARRA